MYVCMYVIVSSHLGVCFFCFSFFLFCLQLFSQPGLAPHHHPLFQVSLISFLLTFFFSYTGNVKHTKRSTTHSPPPPSHPSFADDAHPPATALDNPNCGCGTPSDENGPGTHHHSITTSGSHPKLTRSRHV